MTPVFQVSASFLIDVRTLEAILMCFVTFPAVLFRGTGVKQGEKDDR